MKTMFSNPKKLFLVLITGLILSSCSKDSKDDILVGTWSMQSGTFTAMVGNQTLVEYLMTTFGLTANDAQTAAAFFTATIEQSFTGTVQLKSDNTYTSDLGGESDSGTWSLSADRKKLTITSTVDGPTTLDVVELTSSSLHLSGTEITPVDFDDDGIDETNLSVGLDLIFSKE